jgi:hypothetical protein
MHPSPRRFATTLSHKGEGMEIAARESRCLWHVSTGPEQAVTY